MADLKIRKDGLNFDPVKVTKFAELEKEKTALLKGKGKSQNDKESLRTLLEVRGRGRYKTYSRPMPAVLPFITI